MKKPRSERKRVESGMVRCTRNRSRQQQDEEPATPRNDPVHLLKESPLGKSCAKVRGNPNNQSREMDRSLEETLLAFLETHGIRDVEDIEEDKLTFHDATYARCGVRAGASIPTQKMFEAIFRNVQESRSVELTMAAFQMLKDLDKRHPRVAIAKDEADGSSDQSIQRVDVDRRVWSPIEYLIEEIGSTDMMLPEASADEPIPVNLVTLVETITMNIPEKGSQAMVDLSNDVVNLDDDVKIAGQFLMLEHLVGLIQTDLSCCFQVYEESMDNIAVRKSYLYRLLCVLPADVRKTFLSNLVFLLNPMVQDMETDEKVPNSKEVDYDLTNGKSGLLPSTSDFSHLAFRLLFMVTEIDHVTRQWQDGNARSMRRGSFPDDLLIISNAGDLEAYLGPIDSPKTKLRFIVDYFIANAPPVIVVKGLNDSIDSETFEKLLACFGDDKTEKFVHKFTQDVLPVLLAHAFQAFLIIHVEAAGEDHENERQAKLLKLCLSLVEILTDLRALERQTQMFPVAELAIQMAESILTS